MELILWIMALQEPALPKPQRHIFFTNAKSSGISMFLELKKNFVFKVSRFFAKCLTWFRTSKDFRNSQKKMEFLNSMFVLGLVGRSLKIRTCAKNLEIIFLWTLNG